MVQLRWSRVTTGWRRQDLQAHVTKNPVGDKAAHDGGVEMLRKNCCCLSAIVLTLVLTPASHGTWSIVIADADTREVAVGTVTCLNQFDLLALVPVLVVGKGGAAVQSFGDFDGIRRPIIFDHLMMGTPPEEIFAILENIEGHEGRQYGITDTKGRKITFSGSSNGAWAGGVIGSQCSMHYSIQGNVLTGQCVVDAIEQAVRNTEGDIAAKLMAGMEAARAMGGDGRCSCDSFETESCGCPAQKFAKAGHIGGMAVARIGDADDPLCDAGGCVDGDYFMRLNVAFQGNEDPDPVQQLRQQFNLWRAGLEGRPDAVQSAVALEPPSIPPDGGSTTTMTITLLDRGGLPVDGPILSVTVEHAADSAGHSAIGGVTDNKDGTFSVTLTAGTKLGIDRFAITVDDGIRPVVLMPEPALEYCVRPDCILDCNDNGIVDSCDIGSGTSGDCNGNFFPDECDIASGGSLDCDGNIVPDECEPDCNGNGVADACDIAGDFSTDEDENGIPDDCHGIFRVPEEFSGIQAAIDQALSGDTVLISSGTYSGADNRDLDLAGRDVLVKCRTGPADCIIDCQNSGRGFIFQTAETRSAVIEGLTITNGTANLGGAIYCTNQSSPTIRNCWLLENTATVWGGGIYSDGGSLAVSGCKIQDNVAQGSRGGGGMFLFNQAAGMLPLIENTLFSGNSGRSGGGIYVVSSAPIVRQCTFTGNHAEDSGGGIFVIGAGDPSLIGCIFWGDTAIEGQEITLGASLAAMTVQFSNVAGGAAGVAGVGTLLWGTGNIGEDPILHDPLFADPTGADGDPAATKDNDYHLLTSSPCIDTGDPNFVPPNGETDLAGGTRLVDGDGDGLPIVDMGCYEHQECPADLDGSGSVGVPDLIELLAAWGPNPDHPADFDGNGLVRVPDLIILLGRWGPCI